MLLKQFKCSLDQVAEILLLSLTVNNAVANVVVARFEQVENRENLSVVRDKSLTDGLRTEYECLENFESDSNNLSVACVQSSFDWNDELGNNR